MLPLPCTTTVALEMLGSSSSSSEKYHYFHYELVSLRNCTLRRYNLETTSVNECLRCLRCSCLHRVQIVTRFLVANSWDTRNPGAPHHLLHASAHFSFASVSQSSYRNRNVAVAPFRYRCRGSPFHFRHVDKCFLICPCQLFLNLHKTCSCHPHHDNNFKNV